MGDARGEPAERGELELLGALARLGGVLDEHQRVLPGPWRERASAANGSTAGWPEPQARMWVSNSGQCSAKGCPDSGRARPSNAREPHSRVRVEHQEPGAHALHDAPFRPILGLGFS
ncbi:MAG: hypothetical protein ACT4QB_08125 [Gammaproteobacteria bacterium]